jgi:prevent-host-death family protein
MSFMSITEFNKNISSALARVEKGEELILTRHGKEVALISSRQLEERAAQRSENLARMRELLKKGLCFDGPASYEERTGRG